MDASAAPVTKVWHEPLKAALVEAGEEPDPSNMARKIFAAALQSTQGAKCASCGTVLRERRPDQLEDVTVLQITTPSFCCSVLTCSELCAERIARRGINFEDLE